jgi:hypothetical protein
MSESSELETLHPDYLRRLFIYNPKTGQMFWQHRPIEDFKTEGTQKTWNSRFAGMRTGSLSPIGYLDIGIDGKLYKAHRIAWVIMTGEHPTNQIDHINHDKSDNRFSNLRAVTYEENRRNNGLRADNTSGHNGINWDERRKVWRVRATLKGKEHHLGLFTNIDDAIAARAKFNEDNDFHKNHGLIEVK